jgi:cold shock CspA family protein
MDLHISFHGMDPSPAAEDLIRQQAAELERVSDRLVACRVVVESVNRRHRRGNMYGVRIDLSVAGGHVVVNHDPGVDHRHEELPVAIHDAFHATRRRLQDHMRRLDGEIKQHEEAPSIGAIAQLFPDRGYGFIDAGALGDVYFHRNCVKGTGFAQLKIGDRVRYILSSEPGEHGAHASALFPL